MWFFPYQREYPHFFDKIIATKPLSDFAAVGLTPKQKKSNNKAGVSSIV